MGGGRGRVTEARGPRVETAGRSMRNGDDMSLVSAYERDRRQV